MAISTATAVLYQANSAGLTAGTSGTITTVGAAVTGVGTVLQADLTVGDVLVAVNGAGVTEARLVTAIASELAITLESGFSTDISVGVAYSFSVMEAVADITGIGGPSEQASQVNVSTLGTTGFAEFISGLRSPGTVNFTMFYQPLVASHQRFRARFDSGIILPYLIFYPDSATAVAVPSLTNSTTTLRASVNQFAGDIAIDDAVKRTVTLLVTGKPVEKAGA
jgi:hypothetical protein